jgi:hypothetical protein
LAALAAPTGVALDEVREPLRALVDLAAAGFADLAVLALFVAAFVVVAAVVEDARRVDRRGSSGSASAGANAVGCR